MKKLLLCLVSLCFILSVNLSYARTYHVSPKGSDNNSGELNDSFRTISKAAYCAMAGDTVLIYEGVYREWVSPHNPGMTDKNRITYMAAEGEEVWIKGSEQVSNWKSRGKGIWRAEVDNSIFNGFNPFAVELFGDWLVKGTDNTLGEIYLNNENLNQRMSLEALSERENLWYAEVGDDTTVIYASFGSVNPNRELVEMNVRQACFFPKSTGVNYITVKGLNISQAATQWSPPTAVQEGAIGPNWSKGWIIEDCVVSHSKTVGICLGKDKASGQNNWFNFRYKKGYTKPGFTYEIESIFAALELGWSRENIGSHIVRNNEIFYCGQAGIVGHLGCAFSIVERNRVHDICRIEGLYGHEMAGIKLHAAIDVVLRDNIVYRTSRGIWLDWQVQGTHVDGNIMFDNPREDLFLEVSHGPSLVYNNIMLSEKSLLVNAQGIAYVNNLIGSKTTVISSHDRYTPYHKAHSTELKGMFNNNGGDIRLYNNIFLADGVSPIKKNDTNGLAAYDEYPAYDESYIMPEEITSDRQYLSFLLPIATYGNVYFSEAAKPYKEEVEYSLFAKEDPFVRIVEEEDGFYIETDINFDSVKKGNTITINTDVLGEAVISEAAFENVDGSAFELREDIFGDSRDVNSPTAGPFESGFTRRLLWKKR